MSDFDAIRGQIRAVQAHHRAIEERMRGMLVPYSRRAEMSIPAFKMKAGGDPATEGRAQSLKLMNKAAQLPIDFFFYDLEDAAPDNPDFKVWARKFVVEALCTNDYGDRVTAFRPNNIRTEYFEQDVVEVISQAGHKLRALVIPKTETADEVRDVARIVNAINKASGNDHTLYLEVLIESPRAFAEAAEIAAIPEVAALIFGAWDFARTIGGSVTPQGWIHDQGTVRQLLPVIAAAEGKDAVDAVTGTLPIRPKRPPEMAVDVYKKALVSDPSTLDIGVYGMDFLTTLRRRQETLDLARRDAENACAIGFAAKWILHPDQIDPIQGAWTPSRQRALDALKLTAAYCRAAQSGSGAEVDGSRLADKAVVGTDWWVVKAGLRGGSIGEADIEATGFSFEDLQRTVVTRDAQVQGN